MSRRSKRRKKKAKEWLRKLDKVKYYGFHKRLCKHTGQDDIYGLVPIRTSTFLIHEDPNKITIPSDVKAWICMDTRALDFLAYEDGFLEIRDMNFLYIDVKDMSGFTQFDLDKIMEFILNNIDKGRILISCLGGHGRTGTILAVWAAIQGERRPIKYVRKHYCHEAIETARQEGAIFKYMNWDVPEKLQEKIDRGYLWNYTSSELDVIDSDGIAEDIPQGEEVCIYCGSSNITEIYENCFHCHDCGSYF